MQAFLAFLQGDAVPAQLPSELTGGQPRLSFEPVSMCVVEPCDKATFKMLGLRVRAGVFAE
jgi:hypothetical protein